MALLWSSGDYRSFVFQPNPGQLHRRTKTKAPNKDFPNIWKGRTTKRARDWNEVKHLEVMMGRRVRLSSFLPLGTLNNMVMAHELRRKQTIARCLDWPNRCLDRETGE